MSQSERLLIAFDFDHTIIDDNSDTYVTKLAPGGDVPTEMKGMSQYSGWTEYMGEVFRYLHKHNVTSEDIRQCMEEIPLTPGIHELLLYISLTPNIDAIIISDSNSILIKDVLAFHKLDSVFSETFTNPAKYDDTGCLCVAGYHTQDWCEISTANMCKGSILTDYIDCQQRDRRVLYHAVCYVGDGNNDICPCRTLRRHDVVFPRIGYSLWKQLQGRRRKSEPSVGITAEVVPWDTGTNILDRLRAFALT